MNYSSILGSFNKLRGGYCWNFCLIVSYLLAFVHHFYSIGSRDIGPGKSSLPVLMCILHVLKDSSLFSAEHVDFLKRNKPGTCLFRHRRVWLLDFDITSLCPPDVL